MSILFYHISSSYFNCTFYQYSELRGLTQQQLADFSGIPLGTLKKYETGNRNPKQEPLQRVADALHISITSFQDIHLETIGEVAPYLFAISKVGKVQFHGNKDADGKFDLNTLTISFDSPVVIRISQPFLVNLPQAPVVQCLINQYHLSNYEKLYSLYFL